MSWLGDKSLFVGSLLLALGVAAASWAAPDAGLRDQGTAVSRAAGDAGLHDQGAGARDRGTAALPRWAPKLSARVAPAVATLGDAVQVILKVRHHKGIAVNLPLALELGPFSELSRDEATRELGGGGGKIGEIERTFALRVAAYQLGELTLPPIEVTALGPGGELISLKTEPLPIKVRGLLRNEPNPKPKDLAAPVTVRERTWWFLGTVVGLAVLGLVVIVTLLVNRRLRARRARVKPAAPPIPAHRIALLRLEQIDLEAFIAQEQFKELYLLLSEIVREYVGRRVGFDALEMTTTEIAVFIARGTLSAELQLEFVSYLQACDLVKFAKHRPEAQAARLAHQQALSLVQRAAESGVTLQVTQEAVDAQA